MPSVTPANGKAINSAILNPLIYPCEYRIFSARSCNQRGERPVSSTELMGGGKKSAGLAAGFPRGLFISPPVRAAF
jgi:hypothetical protein